MSFEDEYGVRENRRSWRTILLPVMGFLLIAAAGAIAFIISGPATEFIRDSVRGVPSGDGLQIAVGFGVFLVLMLVFAMLYAMFAPKPTKMISESQLDREKKARQREKREIKKRRRQINREMARQNRDRNN